MKNTALSYLLLACALPLYGAASEQMNTNNQASTVTLITYGANKRRIELPVEERFLLKLDMYKNTKSDYISTDRFDLTDCFSKIDLLLDTGEKDFLEEDSIRTLLTCLTRNPNDEITAYKNACAALSPNNLISLWRAADFLGAPENLKLVCAQRIVHEKLSTRLNEADTQAILTTVRSFHDAVHCLEQPIADKINLAGKKIGWSHDTISPHATKTANNLPNRLQPQSLDLRNNLLTSLDLSYYRGIFPNLNTFDVSGNKITNISAGDFHNLPVGSRVMLNDNQLGDASVDKHAFSGSNGITWDLRRNNLTQEKIATIRAAAGPSWLVALRNRLWQSGQTAQPPFDLNAPAGRILWSLVMAVGTGTIIAFLCRKCLPRTTLNIPDDIIAEGWKKHLLRSCEIIRSNCKITRRNYAILAAVQMTGCTCILLSDRLETSFQNIKLFFGKQFQPNTVIADDEPPQQDLANNTGA